MSNVERMPAEARSAVLDYLARKGLPEASREGLLDAVERGAAAGEADSAELMRRLSEATAGDLEGRIAELVDGIADLVTSPRETLGEG